jgi:hypothetical protein
MMKVSSNLITISPDDARIFKVWAEEQLALAKLNRSIGDIEEYTSIIKSLDRQLKEKK